MIAQKNWKLAAKARGPRRVEVIARSDEGITWRRSIAVLKSASSTEANLLGLGEAFVHLRDLGAEAVLVVVTDPTLDGYLHRGWRPRSLGVLSALRRLLECAHGMQVEFKTAAPGFRASTTPRGRPPHRYEC